MDIQNVYSVSRWNGEKRFCWYRHIHKEYWDIKVNISKAGSYDFYINGSAYSYLNDINFKIVFMSDYKGINIFNDNIDVKVILSTDVVYSATLFTLANIKALMDNSDMLYFKSR